ncbi:MAG: hypothetical protein M5U12_26945 [Verrucomicrobia bacterium]|nr:hypothetical protein [Verrucomicrobiota bacterium]
MKPPSTVRSIAPSRPWAPGGCATGCPNPLAAVAPIRRRQDAVETWLADPASLETFRARLKEVRDLERTLSRLSVGTGNARDLLGLRTGLEQVPTLRQLLLALATPAHTEPQPTLRDLDPYCRPRNRVVRAPAFPRYLVVRASPRWRASRLPPRYPVVRASRLHP